MSKKTKIEVGARALDTHQSRRDFHVRLRDELANESSNAWRDIRKIQADRRVALAQPVIEETVESLRRCRDLGKAIQEGGRPITDKEMREYTALSQRFDRLAYGPTLSQVHIDAALTTLMATYAEGNYIADNLLPYVKVSKPTGSIFKELIQDVQRGEEFTARAAGAEAGEIHFGMDTAVSYSVVEYKAKKGLADSLVRDADAPINLDEMAAQNVTRVLMAGREIRVADLLTTTTTYVSANRATAPSVKWDSASTSDNEHWDDIKTIHNAVSDNCGAPTDVAMNKRVAMALISKDHFRESLIYVTGSLPSFLLGKIAEYCMVERAHIAMGRKTTTNPGQSTQTQGDTWTDSVVFAVVGSPSTHYVGLGVSPATAPLTISRYRDPIEDREREVIWGKSYCDEVIVNDKAGGIIPDVLT
jgi:hypothetical protein